VLAIQWNSNSLPLGHNISSLEAGFIAELNKVVLGAMQFEQNRRVKGIQG